MAGNTLNGEYHSVLTSTGGGHVRNVVVGYGAHAPRGLRRR